MIGNRSVACAWPVLAMALLFETAPQFETAGAQRRAGFRGCRGCISVFDFIGPDIVGRTPVIMNANQLVDAPYQDASDETATVVNLTPSSPAVRATMLTGMGRYCVAGADISGLPGLGRSQGDRYARRSQAGQRQLEIVAFRVIAAVNGFAPGGGRARR